MIASVSFNLEAIYTIVLLKTIQVNTFIMELLGLVVVMEIILAHHLCPFDYCKAESVGIIQILSVP